LPATAATKPRVRIYLKHIHIRGILPTINTILISRSQKKQKQANGLGTDIKTGIEPSLKPAEMPFFMDAFRKPGKYAKNRQKRRLTGKLITFFVDKKQIKEKK
jgi:hypothetical protein